jgi:hypothetical protein
MPTLIVKPIDTAVPGSYAERRKIRRALSVVRETSGRIEQLRAQSEALDKAVSEGNAEAMPGAEAMQREIALLSGKVMSSMLDLEDIVVIHVRTDDGSPVDAVLDVISADDFDKLLRAMLGDAPVPTKSSGS